MKVLHGTSFLLIGFALLPLPIVLVMIDQPGEGDYVFDLWPLGVTALASWNFGYSQRFAVKSDVPIKLEIVKRHGVPFERWIVLEDIGQVSSFERVFPPSSFLWEIAVRFTNPTNESVRVTVTRSSGPIDLLEFLTGNWIWLILASSCVASIVFAEVRWLRRDLTLLSTLRKRGGMGIFLSIPVLFVSALVSALIVIEAGGSSPTFLKTPYYIDRGWDVYTLIFPLILPLVLGYTAFTYCVMMGDNLPRWSRRTAALAYSLFVGLYSIFLSSNITNYLILQDLDPSGATPFLAVVPIASAAVTAAYSLRSVDSVSKHLRSIDGGD